MAPLPLIACRHCDHLHQRLPIPAGALAACKRCGHVLYRQSGLPLRDWIAIVLAALLVFIIANCFPVVQLTMQGMTVRATLPQALWTTWGQGHELVAAMTALFALALPLGQIVFLFWALRAVSRRRLPPDFRFGMRVLHAMTAWSMVPVLMLAILVAIVKLADLAVLHVDAGLWAFAACTVLLTMLGRVTALRVWRYAEDERLVEVSGSGADLGGLVAGCQACGFVQNLPRGGHGAPCGRCGARVHQRKPASFSRAWALIAAAAILYIPANVLPVMHIRTPAGTTSHTILGGVMEFWQTGSWDLALIVFVASVVVPMTKLLALAVLMLRSRWDGPAVQRQRTRLYELVEFIGQWSMLDVFVVVLLSAMADFPGFSQITAGPGAAAFGMVVILTMFAAMSYDPRLGWDAAPAPKEYAE